MPRAVQRATAAAVPYSMSSGCATTQSTRWKDSSGRAGKVMPAILPELFQDGNRQVGPRSVAESDLGLSRLRAIKPRNGSRRPAGHWPADTEGKAGWKLLP